MKNYILIACLIMVTPNILLAQKFKWNKNQVIAHRGAWKKNNLPENSIASLKEAVRIGCHGSEFDTHLTSDNVIVVNHDPAFQGLKIEESTYAQLLEKSLSNGEKIPTLEAYLKEGKKQKTTKLILEMKPSKISKARGIELSNACFNMVKKLKMEAWVEYISFDYEELQNIRRLDPNAIIQYLNGDASAEKLKADGFNGADYTLSLIKKEPNWFTKTKAIGLTLNVWTVNAEADMKWLLENKTEYLTTNEPELLFEVLKNKTF